MYIPKWAIAAGLLAAAILAWGLFHPTLRPDPQSIPAAVRAEIAKAGFKATQGVASVSFHTVEWLDGDRAEFTSRQTIAAIDAFLTEKHSQRLSKGLAQETRGLYAGPLTVVRLFRNRPALVGELLPNAFWTSTRLTDFAVEERADFPQAAGGRLIARLVYEDRYADGQLAATSQGRVRCDVTRLVPAASINARLAGLAARIECTESMQVVEVEPDEKAPPPAYDARLSYAHWYILERGWSIASEGEYPVRVPGFNGTRKWSSRLTSFD